jgi:hypothetical protein
MFAACAMETAAGARTRRQLDRKDAMVPASYFIARSGHQWTIRFRDESFGPYRSRDEALLFAIDAAEKIGERESDARVLVEDVKGLFLTRWRFGAASDPA